MSQKRYNKKARFAGNVEIDDSSTKKIALDIQYRTDDYDKCNAFVLPSKKRSTKNINNNVTKIRLLSKKRRKELEKVVERKKKKLQRTELLQQLAEVQVNANEIEQYKENTADTKKRKRKKSSRKNRKKRLVIPDESKNEEKEKQAISDPNIDGVEDSSDSSDDDEDDNDMCDNVANPEITVIEKNEVEDVEKSVENEETIDKPEEDEKLGKVEEKSQIETKQQEQQEVVRTPAVFVPVNRTSAIQKFRFTLPVVGQEQIIMETINENPIVIITGETGSGKTTQVPQFLYEAGYAKEKMIGITEPRRVAAISMSKRVSEEMSLSQTVVSYQVRFDGNVTDETKIKFMTDGILLKEIQNDFLLTKYSVIILDEAHERSVETDILVGFLSKIVPLRAKRNDPLKLIIMSATLRAEEFLENKTLFPLKPPLIVVEGRHLPVTIHFNRWTKQNYVQEAIKKTIKIHTQLPPGGILIFLTGQQEVQTVVRKLKQKFPYKKPQINQSKTETLNETIKKSLTKGLSSEEESSSEEDLDGRVNLKKELRNLRRKKEILKSRIINLDNYSIPIGNADNSLGENNLDEDEEEEEDQDVNFLEGIKKSADPLLVLPLYSLLSNYEQARVFKPPPEGCRLCIVSTNIAETSLTIPNIRYVVDSGRCKIKMYDKLTGVSKYEVCYTSKASASQRAGRAGRTTSGYCYRLYSSAVYNNDFKEYDQPEILRKPLDDLVLQLKAMGIRDIANFPFPTSPDIEQLKSAENQLMILGALKPARIKEIYDTKVTELGKNMAKLPIAPCYAKMLLSFPQYNLAEYTICLVAALSFQDILQSFNTYEDEDTQARHKFLAADGHSFLMGDPMILLKTIGAAEYFLSENPKEMAACCREFGLNSKALIEVRKLRKQLTNKMNAFNFVPNSDLIVNAKMKRPTDNHAKLLRRVILAGKGNHVAKRISLDEVTDDNKTKWKHAYRTPELQEPVFMKHWSIFRKINPEWIVYQDLYETGSKIYMRGITVIEPEWLPEIVPTLCNLSKPPSDTPPSYNSETGKVTYCVSGTFGRAAWPLPSMHIEHPLNVHGVRWFACFFLEGQVCPKLKRFVPSLLNTPGSITKSWSNLIPRTQVMTDVLLSHKVICKDKLVEIWNSDKEFLLSAYQMWLPQSMHTNVALLWPPL